MCDIQHAMRTALDAAENAAGWKAFEAAEYAKKAPCGVSQPCVLSRIRRKAEALLAARREDDRRRACRIS